MKIAIYWYNYVVARATPFARDISSLAIRIILAPVMIIAGYSKLNLSNEAISGVGRLLPDANVVSWFGNAQWGLGLPFPDTLAFLAGWTEFLGGWLILVGLFTRFISIPLMITMFVAVFTVHLNHGWFAITPTDPDTSPAKVLSWLHVPGSNESLMNSVEARERLAEIKAIINNHDASRYLKEKGSVVLLNNGIEFALTYLILLMVLFTQGPGRYLSVDYWFRRANFTMNSD
ncbi:FIG01057559: hypothetical protein [Pseudoalteromonas luteoviolacea B = ATCC 29581]|nr:FIG01057559: hypothetical protein [Pseudoalteromonas luteoviolacea B = ATCC 29581]